MTMGSKHRRSSLRVCKKTVKINNMLFVKLAVLLTGLLHLFHWYGFGTSAVNVKDENNDNNNASSLRVPVSTVLLPHMEWGDDEYRIGPCFTHLLADGLNQSSVLVASSVTGSVDSTINLAWIVDMQAIVQNSKKAGNWCMTLLSKVKQTQEEQRRRRQVGGQSVVVWPIHFVDSMDSHKFQERCTLLEQHMGMENIHYHKRGVVANRFFDGNSGWVRLGERLKESSDGVQFHHTPLGVRTDIVKAIDSTLREQGGSFLINNAIENIPRDIDVSYFWQLTDPNGHRETYSSARLRNVVYHSLEQMQQQYGDRYTIALGFKGDTAYKGRTEVSSSYVQALLSSKIVVLAQRDQWEDQYRVMEALAAGSLVLTDKMLSLAQGLEDGVSIVEYTSEKDMQDKIKYYLEHKQERIEIAGRGRQVAMSRYRSWHQLEEIVLGNPVTHCSGQECMTVNNVHRGFSLV